MKACLQCKRQIADSAKFCKFCGEKAPRFLLATRSTRFTNAVLDSFFSAIIAGIGVGFIDGFFGFGFSEDETSLLVFGAIIVYYILGEFYGGRTLAKVITRTRVVDKSGKKATFGQILGRTIVRHVPFDALSFLFGQRPVGWHDSWSGTRVVQE